MPEPRTIGTFAKGRQLMAGKPVSLLHARIPAQPDVTPASLATMEAHMTGTASLLPAGLDVIGYGCTSGATVIGPDRVADLIRQAHPGSQVTNPLSAVIAALEALKAKRIGLLTPYVETVNQPLIAALGAAGIEVVIQDSFLQDDDWTVARIAEEFSFTVVWLSADRGSREVRTSKKIPAFAGIRFNRREVISTAPGGRRSCG